MLFATHDCQLNALAITPDGNQVVAGTGADELIIWDRADGDEFGRTIPVHIGDITAIAVTPNGARVVTGIPRGAHAVAGHGECRARRCAS